MTDEALSGTAAVSQGAGRRGKLHAVFFRNLNLGHRGSPTGAQLVEAFGGPERARGFQTNGTVVLRSAAPARDLRAARQCLAALGYQHEAVRRPLTELATLLAEQRAHAPRDGIYRRMVSLFDLPRAGTPDSPQLPLLGQNGLIEVRLLADGHAISDCWKTGTTSGDPTSLLERRLGVPVTSRTVDTIQRLVTRFGVRNIQSA